MTIHTTIVGNVTGPPELKFSQAGKPWATFTVADNRKEGDVEKASFIRCKVFGELAENIAESLDKGMRVVIVGRLIQEEWEKDGEKRSALVLIVDAAGPDLRWATARVARTPVSGTTSAPLDRVTTPDPWASVPAADDSAPF